VYILLLNNRYKLFSKQDKSLRSFVENVEAAANKGKEGQEKEHIDWFVDGTEH
jgi:hypothetical protein